MAGGAPRAPLCGQQDNRWPRGGRPVCRAPGAGPLILILVAGLAATPRAQAVVVDGTLDGPSALRNQSQESQLIATYNTKDCGISDVDEDYSDFVNAARPGQFPWLASLQQRPYGRWQHFCMASFISDRWLLSAAHCFADGKPINSDEFRVSAGSTEVHGGQNVHFAAKRVFYHKQFDHRLPIGFDVALVELNGTGARISTRREEGKPFINTVCLPISAKQFKPGQAVKLAGWGDTKWDAHNSKPNHLFTTDLLLTNASACADIFAKLQKNQTVNERYRKYEDLLCAEYQGKRDACQGDSGASLLEYADNKAVAVGIVSFGYGCATAGAPGVYERVSSMMPWIEDIVQNKERARVRHVELKSSWT